MKKGMTKEKGRRGRIGKGERREWEGGGAGEREEEGEYNKDQLIYVVSQEMFSTHDLRDEVIPLLSRLQWFAGAAYDLDDVSVEVHGRHTRNETRYRK